MFSSPKQTILHRYRNEINTAKQLNYFTNIHLLIPWFINSLCVITIKVQWLMSYLCPIPNGAGWGICLRMWKPGKEVALNNAFFTRGPRRPRYNGVAVYRLKWTYEIQYSGNSEHTRSNIPLKVNIWDLIYRLLLNRLVNSIYLQLPTYMYHGLLY